MRVVAECVDFPRLHPGARALDLGCAVGRSSFELARHCTEVVGIDFSARFVEAGEALRASGRLPYRYSEEGSLQRQAEAIVPGGIDRQRVRFERGDACDLRGDLGQFDVALLINLLDRLPNPRKCLSRLPQLLRSGGQLIIASPFTWLEEYTPRANWLGGYSTPDGHWVESFPSLCDALASEFEFVRALDLPFLIREHARKFQWSVSRAGIWRRR